MIDDIEHFGTGCQLPPLPKTERASEGNVDVDRSRADEHISSEVTKRPRGLDLKARRIEVNSRIPIGITSGNIIGPVETDSSLGNVPPTMLLTGGLVAGKIMGNPE